MNGEQMDAKAPAGWLAGWFSLEQPGRAGERRNLLSPTGATERVPRDAVGEDGFRVVQIKG